MATTITATVSPTTGPVQLVTSKVHGTVVCLSQGTPRPKSSPASASTSASASVSISDTQQDTSHTSSPNSSTTVSSDAQQLQNLPAGSQSAPSAITTTQPAPPTSNTTVPQQRPGNDLKSVIAGASLNNILCFLGLVVAVIYGAIQTSYVIWTGRNDARESCRDDQAIGISSDYCRRILSSGVQAPPLSRRSIYHAVPFLMTSKVGFHDHAILAAVTAIVLTLAIGIYSLVWLHPRTRLPTRLVVSVVRVAYNLIAPIAAELGRYTFEKLSGIEADSIEQTPSTPEQVDNDIDPPREENDEEVMSDSGNDMTDTCIRPTRITNFATYSEESLVENCSFLLLSESTASLPIIVSDFSEDFNQLEIGAQPPDGGPMIGLDHSNWFLWRELFSPHPFGNFVTSNVDWRTLPSKGARNLPENARKRSESLPDNRTNQFGRDYDFVNKRNKRRNSEIETSREWQGIRLPFSSSIWVPRKQAWWFSEHEKMNSGRDPLIRSELDSKEIEGVAPQAIVPLENTAGKEHEMLRSKRERKTKTRFTDRMLWDVAKKQLEMLQLDRKDWRS